MQLEVYNPEAGLENYILSKGIYRISYNLIINYSITMNNNDHFVGIIQQ